MSELIPIKQELHINSSDGRIFDFNTPSSRVYLGETINSLLKPFGKSCVLVGLTVKNVEYLENDIVRVTINPGEVVIDTTFISYPDENIIDLDVSGYDENNGFLILSIMFNFIGIMKKNYSKFMLSYVTHDGNVPNRVWYTECENIILSKIVFNKNTKTARNKAIDFKENRKVIIEDKSYDIYPLDNISKRIVLLFQSFFG
jgi:hypothetical protein